MSALADDWAVEVNNSDYIGSEGKNMFINNGQAYPQVESDRDIEN